MKTNYLNLMQLDSDVLGSSESIEDKAKRLGVPIIPAIKKEDKQPFDTNPILGICGECGVEWGKMMYYSCNRSNCPMQIKTTL